MLFIIVSLIIFTAFIMGLVFILMFAESKLVAQGDVTIGINGDVTLAKKVSPGATLLTALSEHGIFIPSACGGGGTCAQCRCQVIDGGGDILPTETGHISRTDADDNWRLACQVKIKQDMQIQVPDEIFNIQKYEAKVVRNYNVASFIKEFVVEVPSDMPYEAGGYIQIEIPECEVKYSDMDITAHPSEHPGEPTKFQEEWDKFKLWPLKMVNKSIVERAYSMASYPAEGREIMLNVRVACPPFDPAIGGWANVNPGIASSYIFSLNPGDTVTISGPFGEFFINESEAEMLYVGGGAGMAPMRSHLYHLFKTLQTGRKVSYWYGGRSKRELFYLDHFYELEKHFPNFKFYIVLSDPMPADNWVNKTDTDDSVGDGFTGFVHNAVIKEYLDKHDTPEDLELYFCGPPMMNVAVQKMGEDFGIPDEHIRFDDFGG